MPQYVEALCLAEVLSIQSTQDCIFVCVLSTCKNSCLWSVLWLIHGTISPLLVKVGTNPTCAFPVHIRCLLEVFYPVKWMLVSSSCALCCSIGQASLCAALCELHELPGRLDFIHLSEMTSPLESFPSRVFQVCVVWVCHTCTHTDTHMPLWTENNSKSLTLWGKSDREWVFSCNNYFTPKATEISGQIHIMCTTLSRVFKDTSVTEGFGKCHFMKRDRSQVYQYL